jgi:hypothetical protein
VNRTTGRADPLGDCLADAADGWWSWILRIRSNSRSRFSQLVSWVCPVNKLITNCATASQGPAATGGEGRRTCPQLALSDSLALRRLYHGILLLTWWGTCTLMSCVRNSTLQSDQRAAEQVSLWNFRSMRCCKLTSAGGAQLAAQHWRHATGKQQKPLLLPCCKSMPHSSRGWMQGATGNKSGAAQAGGREHGGCSGWCAPGGEVAVHGARQLRLRRVPGLGGLEGDVRRGVVHHREGGHPEVVACTRRGQHHSDSGFCVWCTTVKVDTQNSYSARQGDEKAQI